ncbi:MAG: universal stress protein [Armatimonadetes bacterium]|nr:universal stress protein [Armatimonadota bacterium]
MFEFQPASILCPTDFSPFSETALRYALAIARLYRARLHLIHADTFLSPLEFITHDVGVFALQIEEIRQATQRSLARYLEEKARDIEADASLIEHPPAQAILEAAESLKADLIVMGTHGRGGLNRLLLGSVTENVVRQARSPVLTVRGAAPEGEFSAEPGLPQRILCPVNFTRTAYAALSLAASVAARTGAALSVLVADERQDASADPQKVREKLCQGVPEEILSCCVLDIHIRKGNAAEQILRHAREERSELIVIGGQRTTFFEGTVFSATTVRVMRHSACPVLIVPCCD